MQPLWLFYSNFNWLIKQQSKVFIAKLLFLTLEKQNEKKKGFTDLKNLLEFLFFFCADVLMGSLMPCNDSGDSTDFT